MDIRWIPVDFNQHGCKEIEKEAPVKGDWELVISTVEYKTL